MKFPGQEKKEGNWFTVLNVDSRIISRITKMAGEELILIPRMLKEKGFLQNEIKD